MRIEFIHKMHYIREHNERYTESQEPPKKRQVSILPKIREEDSSEDPLMLKENYQKVTKKVHRSLKNMSILHD